MMAYRAQIQKIESSATGAFVPSLGATFSKGVSKGVYIGGSGDLSVTMADGTAVIFKNLATGVIHPISCTKIAVTGTTATSLVVVY